MAKDYYKILGVEKTANDDELKSAFRKKAKEFHPDVNKSADAEAKFKEVNEAYEVLSDKTKRSNYDRFGTADPGGFGGGGFSGGQGGFGNFGGFNFGGGGFEFNFGGFENIFDMFGGGGTRQQSNKGSDIELRINLSFQEAAFGAKKTFNITKTKKCGDCGGSGARDGKAVETCKQCGGSGQVRQTQASMFGFGRVQTVVSCNACNGTGKIIKDACKGCGGKGIVKSNEEVTIEIPAGIDNGEVLTVKGGGNAGRGNFASGDLHIQAVVHAHPVLKRHGYDLSIDVFVPFTTLAIGGSVKVPLPKGSFNFTIPEGTQNGQQFREKNKGIKHVNRNMYGDLFIKVFGEFPKGLTKQHKQMLKDIENELKQNDLNLTKQYNNVVNSL